MCPLASLFVARFKDDDDEEGSGGSGKKRAKVGGDAPPVEQPDVLDLNAPDWEKKLTPLHMAISLGCVDMVKLLVQSGARPDVMVLDGTGTWFRVPRSRCGCLLPRLFP